MLESLGIIYEARDFWGRTVQRNDTITLVSRENLDKALGAVKRGCTYVHAQYDDGQHDCVYADYQDLQDGTWTLCHWDGPNSRDDPVRVSPREARKRIREAAAKGLGK